MTPQQIGIICDRVTGMVQNKTNYLDPDKAQAMLQYLQLAENATTRELSLDNTGCLDLLWRLGVARAVTQYMSKKLDITRISTIYNCRCVLVEKHSTQAN